MFPEELETVQEVWPYLMNLYNGETELTVRIMDIGDLVTNYYYYFL